MPELCRFDGIVIRMFPSDPLLLISTRSTANSARNSKLLDRVYSRVDFRRVR